MKLIIGLGNPEEKYKNNRHNAGYLTVDGLLKKKLPKDIIVKKTNISMNSSGEIVNKLVDQYNIELSNLWIIHDDLDIPLGSYKIQKGIGPKLHNGIASVDEELGNTDYWRVRIGIENRGQGPHFAKASRGEEKVVKVPKGIDYVLQDFSQEEREILDGVIEKVVRGLLKTIYECNVEE